MLVLLAAFLTMIALDWVWARYTRAVSAKAPLRAGMNAAAISVLSGVLTLFYVSIGWKMTFATGAGAFVGTYLSVKWGA